MNYLVMLGNEEYFTGFDEENKTAQSSRDKEEIPKGYIFTNQTDALAMLEEVRNLFNGDEGVRVVLDA
ncbi:TPA_asm: hypothetical protein GJA98_15025 [Listeria monocytogenes]|nr:hypothetical protein [Listeria monocytogenes]